MEYALIKKLLFVLRTHIMNVRAILVLDFGSQYSQLIARRIREIGVYTKVIPYYTPLKEIKDMNIAGIILSGSPASVYAKDAPTLNMEIFNLKIPVLGICYGMQLIVKLFGGLVSKDRKQEYGSSEIFLKNEKSLLFSELPNKFQIIMSHGDSIEKIPNNFKQLAFTKNCIASISNEEQKIYGLQFHPEVTHSEFGDQIVKNFVFKICQSQANWSLESNIEIIVEKIKLKVGSKKVILGLSGGTDSLVCALLIKKAIKENLICVFVNTGLLRKNEDKKILELKHQYDLNIKYIDASEKFLNHLKNISDPERKKKNNRKRICKRF